MDIIIGGAYQGKLAFAKKHYRLGGKDCFDLASGAPEKAYKCFYHFEALTASAAADGVSIDDFVEEFCRFAKDPIVISREIGSGIVPMDEEQRHWREYHGMALTRMAKRADRVIRVFCGLPEVLK